jgi:SH3 domain-containing protein
MNRLLILLCMVWWALYIVQTNSNRSGHIADQGAKAFPSHATQAAATSIQPQTQPIASAAAPSPHAIVPDETPRQASPSSSVPPPQTDNMKSLSQADQEFAREPASSQEPEEQLKVTSETSIRSGPSTSAQLIGKAHAGATLRVKSREAGWVQFVDPVANETGWISMAYLGPTDSMENTRSVVSNRAKQAPRAAKLKKAKPIPKVAKLKTPKPVLTMRRLPPAYAEFPPDQEFGRPRRFGLYLSRRWADDFMPPPYR